MGHIVKEMALGERAGSAMDAAGIAPTARPEDVTVEQWVDLHAVGGWKVPDSDV